MLAPIIAKPRNEEEELAQMELVTDMDCQFTVNAMASNLLKGVFSIKETRHCDECKTSDIREVPVVSVHTSLRADLSNFTDALLASFIDPACSECNVILTIDEREFGSFLLLEVSDCNKT